MKEIKSIMGRDVRLEARDGAEPRLAVTVGEMNTPGFVVALDVLLPALAEELGLFILPEAVLPEVEDFGEDVLAAGVCRSLRHWSDAELEEEITARVAILLHRRRARTAEAYKMHAEIATLDEALRREAGLDLTRVTLERLHRAGVRVVTS